MIDGESVQGPGSRGTLRIAVRPIDSLSDVERQQMFELMAGYFADMDRRRFEQDLDEKQVAIVLAAGDSGRVEGFSTLTVLRTTVNQESIAAIFSGDSILAPQCRGRSVWMRHLLRYIMELADQQPESTLYWLLITCTPVVYRCLPAFAQEYYPRPATTMPTKMAKHLEALVELKFPGQYDRTRGVVIPNLANPVRADARKHFARSNNPHVEFFAAANPRFLEGAFLPCICPCYRENLTSEGRRLVEGVK